jgi:hypothetical protein
MPPAELRFVAIPLRGGPQPHEKAHRVKTPLHKGDFEQGSLSVTMNEIAPAGVGALGKGENQIQHAIKKELGDAQNKPQTFP